MTLTTPTTIQNPPCPVVGRTVAAPHNRRGGLALNAMRNIYIFNSLEPMHSVARRLV
jgi:hypothetical protein